MTTTADGWKNLIGATFNNVMQGKNVYQTHLHPRVDPQVDSHQRLDPVMEAPKENINTQTDYAIHVVNLKSRVMNKSSDYTDILSIADILEDHVSDKEARLKLAARIYSETSHSEVNVSRAIDEHVKELESFQRIVSQADPDKSAIQMRIENLKQEVDQLNADTAARREQILALEQAIREHQDTLDHNQEVAAKIMDDISEAERSLETPFDKAVADVKTALWHDKELLNDSQVSQPASGEDSSNS